MHLSCQPLLLLWVWRQFASKAISIISRVWRLWTQISKDQQSVGGDENAEDMISIFGSKSFNSFRALKKFAICFRQHPMVTMWQTLFSTNFFEIFLTKHIFSSFPNTIKYANVSKSFCSFSPPGVSLLVETWEMLSKSTIWPVKSVFFSQSWPTTKTFFV